MAMVMADDKKHFQGCEQVIKVARLYIADSITTVKEHNLLW